MSDKVVCIVGRPNVGKSTLFNKLAGKRIAITEDTPGVTRDRIYAKANWLGNEFTVIDTGGLDIKDDDIFMKNIANQVEIAIDMADCILFLIDGVNGITSADEDIAMLLRKSNKPVIPVVNKLDTKGVRDSFYDYFVLGFGTPYMISAEGSLGLGDLLDAILDVIGKNTSNADDKDKIRVAFIGKPNVGKSSLINKIIGEERNIVTNIAGTTRDSIDSYFKYNDTPMVFVDTAGLRKRKKITDNVEKYSTVRTLAAVDHSDVCVLVIDATQGVVEQDTKIAGYAHDNNKALIIAVNKWDLIEKNDRSMNTFEREVREMLGYASYAPTVYISAKTGQRLYKLLDTIIAVYNNYNLRIPTGVLNDIINKAVLFNQPPSDKGRRGKIYYATQIGVAPPRFKIFVNDNELIHFSYVRYLENQIRQHYAFTGTRLVIELKQKGDD